MHRVILCLALFMASPSFANNKTLFVNGVYAANYGDISYDKGDWRGNNFSAIRVKAGIQILRIDFVGLTLGFQKVGFYDGLYKWSGTNKVKYDYRGPVLELHLFPDSPIGFSVAGMTGSGYSYSTSPELYKISNCPSPACSIESERSSIKVREFTAYVTAKVSYGLHAFVGAGTRLVKGNPEYDIRYGAVHSWVEGDAEKWEENKALLLIGLRGTTL